MGKWRFHASENDDYAVMGPVGSQIRTVEGPDIETARAGLVDYLNATTGGDWHADAEGE